MNKTINMLSFNSTKVRLKDFENARYDAFNKVSIPLRYD